MSGSDLPPDHPSGALAREAANWFARMRGPEAASHQDAFETWLAKDAAHRGAYNRAAEIFAMGKLLADPLPSRAAPRQRVRAATVLAGCAALIVVGGGWMLLHKEAPAPASGEIARSPLEERRKLSTVVGEARVIRLSDGSIVRLEPETVLRIDYKPGQRQLRLARGRARFEVAHDGRPFVVVAGGGSVTARGTIFDVGLTSDGRVDVHLLEGVVDVVLPGGRSSPATSPARRLTKGESVSFASAPGTRPSQPARDATRAGTPARDFAGVTVGSLVAEANRDAARPLRLAEASLAAKRVSGRFRVDETGVLAERLAALFGASADYSNPEEIVLRR